MFLDLDRLRRQVRDQAAQKVRIAVDNMTRDLKDDAPVVTGEMKRTTGVEITSITDRRIVAEARIDVDYAEYVTQGTRPHVIVPRKPGGVLVFQSGGETVFTRRVNHPGTQANPFYDNIVNRWSEYLRSAYAR